VVNDPTVFHFQPPMQMQMAAAAGMAADTEWQCPSLLANYCDLLLRRTSLPKRLISDDIDSKLSDVVSEFHFVPIVC
jgi:hypothetical protein